MKLTKKKEAAGTEVSYAGLDHIRDLCHRVISFFYFCFWVLRVLRDEHEKTNSKKG
jgi:hypothetical protein